MKRALVPAIVAAVVAAIVALLVGGARPSAEPSYEPQGLIGGGPISSQGGGGLASVTTSSPLQGTGSSGSAVTLAAPTGTKLADSYVWNGSQFVRKPIVPTSEQVWWFEEKFKSATCTAASPATSFTGAATGGASVVCNVMESSGLHARALSISTGTGASDGYRFLTNGPTAQFGTVAAPLIQRCVRYGVKITNVGTSVDWYAAHFGFSEPTALTTESVDAVEAVADVKNQGAFWALQTAQNNGGGANTTIKKCDGTGGTTALPIMANTIYALMVCVDETGSNATLNYTLDSGNTYTPCATITTNIPTGNARVTGYGGQVFNQAGSSPISQLFQVLYVEEVAVCDSTTTLGCMAYSTVNAGNLSIADDTATAGDGQARPALTVQLPKTFNRDPFRERPLVMIASSRGIAPATLQAQYGLTNLATDMDAIVVLLSGRTGTQTNQWNENRCCCWRDSPSDGTAPDDVAYIAAVPTRMKAKGWPINLKAVYSVDEGGGGGVMFRVACERPDVLAAMVDVNGAMVGTVEGTGDPTCTPNTTHSLAIAAAGGTLDTSQEPWTGNGGKNANQSNTCVSRIDTTNGVSGGTMEQLKAFAGCSGTLTTSVRADEDLSSDVVGVDTQYLTYTSCPPSRPVELWRITGEDHTFNATANFSTRVISFFNAHPKP